VPDEAGSQFPDAVGLYEVGAVFDGDLYQEHAGKCRHAVQVRGHADDAGGDIRVGEDEIDGGDGSGDGGGGAVEKVVGDGLIA
jgi:hypothetical protein